MMQSPCAYCGADAATAFTSRGSTILYNGLDRRDSNLGYIEGNVSPCCRVCNIAKGSMSVFEFITWVYKIHNFQESQRGG